MLLVVLQYGLVKDSPATVSRGRDLIKEFASIWHPSRYKLNLWKPFVHCNLVSLTIILRRTLKVFVNSFQLSNEFSNQLSIIRVWLNLKYAMVGCLCLTPICKDFDNFCFTAVSIWTYQEERVRRLKDRMKIYFDQSREDHQVPRIFMFADF